ncbi:E1 [Trichechus manatus latirostris papillomavirus 1]|uniref:Replication protein E1 n=1 Tax=Trichechus manatus papillomavirus 1 TaxID=291589 RepID=Q5UUY3_9PAPI|nr:E1 [Trichechus manatus latirostris papillomavirus 1]AAU11448.1 E1 [Trichechus manatus latirostris papillomavirus 1]
MTDKSGEYFLLQEAECSDSDTTDEEIVEENSENGVDFIDDGVCTQGNTLAEYNRKEADRHKRDLEQLKRRHVRRPKLKDSEGVGGSPSSISDYSDSQSSKRRCLRGLENDSGILLSQQDEVTNSYETGNVQVELPGGGQGTSENLENIAPVGRGRAPEELLRSANRQATFLGKFKDTYGISFTELTRPFKSDKTCCEDWVAALYGISGPLYEGAKQLLEGHVIYMQLTLGTTANGLLLLMLLRLKHAKSRATLRRLLQNIFNISEMQLLAEPPKTRSVPVALFWYKGTLSSLSYNFGTCPEWIHRQTLINHQSMDELKFDLSSMIQWAYDYDYDDECTIAYQYARLAETDANANAWLNSPAQARYVKDTATMVKYYKRAQMREMTMGEWIKHRLEKIDEEGDWKKIVQFIRFQGIEFPLFFGALKKFLHGIPKHNCIVIWGPPDTGKSMFCMNLIKLLGGKIISFANSKSQFWLQPLADAKVGLLDDATGVCWDYIDQYLRNALDGNPISIDLKHRAPTQMKCPPLLITTNLDITANSRWRYLVSRVACFKFSEPFPFTDRDTPTYPLTECNWKALLERLWKQLDFPEQEEEDGSTTRPFKCGAKQNTGLI